MKFNFAVFARCFVLIWFLQTLSSCKTTKVTVEAPIKESDKPAYQRKLSMINLPITMQIKPLETRLNATLDKEMYSDHNIEDDDMELVVTRTGDIKISANNNQISYSVPLHIWAKARWKWEPCAICPTLEKSQATEFDINVKCKTSVAITENWSLDTKTFPDYQWGIRPSVDIGPIKIPVARIVEPIMNRQLADVAKLFDAELAKRIDVRAMVIKAWTDVQQPILLNQEMQTWLKLSPTEVRTSSITCQNNEVNLRVGIKAYIETFNGAKPPVTLNKTLPKLIIDNNMKDNFSVSLSGEIPFEYATRLMQDQFKGKEFSFDNNHYKIKVNEVEIYGSTDKLVAKLDIEGKARKGIFTKKIKGSIFVQGIPYYDPQTSIVSVKDFDFNFKTKDILLKTASWVTKVGFKESIQRQLQIPLKDKIEEARKMVQDGLNKNGRINENVLLKGNITSLQPEGVYLTPLTIKAVVTGEGTVSVIIDKF